MDFLSPNWLYLILLPLILLVAGIIVQKKTSKAWKAFVSSPKLAARLVSNTSKMPFWVSIAFIVMSAMLMIVTLCMPTGGQERIELETKGNNIYIAVDLSRSMLVQDVSPDRLTFAKTAALDIIEAFPDEQIGLISFAGNAWLEAPLTSDHNALREAVLQMNQNTIPFGGSDSSTLMRLLLETVPEEEDSEALVIMISDGEFHETISEKMINKVVNKGFRIFTLGVGTLSGGQIPDETQPDGIYKNRLGRPVLSVLKTTTLERIALLGEGKYYAGDDYIFLPLIRTALGLMQGTETGLRSLIIYKHLYSYFLIPSLLFIIFAMLTPNLWKSTQKATIVGLFFFLLPSPNASASFREGVELMQAEKYEEAAQYYQKHLEKAEGELKNQIEYSRGVSSYKGELYPEALEAFSNSLLSENTELQTESHYNLGNTLYKFGETLNAEIPNIKSLKDQILAREHVITQWQDALDHYNSSITLTPTHPTAQPNYDYVKERLEELQKTQEELLKMIQEMQQSGEGEGDSEGDGSGKKGKGGKGSGSPTWDDLQKGKESGEEDQPGGEEDDEGDLPGGEEDEGDQPGKGEGEEELPGSGGEGEEDDNGGSGNGDRTEELERRPNETQEDYARRRLKEHSDFESGNLRTYRKTFSRQPKKDW